MFRTLEPGRGKLEKAFIACRCSQAIANYMNRHVVNIKLGEVKTKTQLHGLFFDEQMRVASDDVAMPGNEQTFTIPIARRLYVLEVTELLIGVLHLPVRSQSRSL